MFNVCDLAAMLYLQEARAKRRLFSDHLYSPAEVAEICSNRGHPLHPGWYVGGEMHPSMFNEAWTNPGVVLHSARVLQSPSGLLYAVMAQQMGHWQHRHLLQLVGEEAEQFLRETRDKPLRFTLANSDGPQATVLCGPEDMQLLLPAGVDVSPVPSSLADLDSAITDCMRVATLMLAVDELPNPGPGYPEVSDVCVSVIQCESLVATIESRITAAGGRKVQ